MNQYDQTLKTYADNGLRTLEDWAGFGRDIDGGTEPRTNTALRGQNVALYSRDQTRCRAQSTAPRAR
jgi:hypothetical protein